MSNHTAQPGDTVELKDKETGFTDPETGFDISRDQKVKLTDPVGRRTHEAIVSGGLLIVSGGKASKSSTDESSSGGSQSENTLPEDLPGRDVLFREGITLDQARDLDQEGLVAVKGIGEKTAVAILDYFKK